MLNEFSYSVNLDFRTHFHQTMILSYFLFHILLWAKNFEQLRFSMIYENLSLFRCRPSNLSSGEFRMKLCNQPYNPLYNFFYTQSSKNKYL